MDNEKNHVNIKKEIVEMGDDALERKNMDLAILGWLQFDEKIIQMQIECQQLKAKAASGTAAKQPDGSGAKIEEGYGDVCEEHLKIINGKDMIIYELNMKLNELKNESFDKDQKLGLLKERLRASERREAQMKEEIEKLGLQELESSGMIEKLRYEVSQVEAREKHSRERSVEACVVMDQFKNQKMAAEARLRKSEETVKQLRQKQLESDRTVEELRRQNLEAHQKVEDLRGQLLVCELHKKACDRTVEDLRRKDVEALQNVEGLMRQKSEAEIERRESDRKMEEIQQKLLEAERRIKELCQIEEDLKRQNLAAYKAAEVFKNKHDKLVHIAVGLAEMLNAKVDDLVNPESKGSSEAREEEGVNFRVSESGKRVSRDEIVDGGRSNVKLPRTSSICNSAESGPNSLLQRGGDTSLALESGILSTLSATEIIDITGDCDDETNLGAGDAKVVNLCTDLLPSGSHNSSDRKGTNTSRTWMFGTDMLRAFEEDDELCLKAVCALYRLKVSAPESGYYHFESMRGNALAEYLIDGDPQRRLRKSVSQVKLESAETIDKCRRIAVHYYERLFMLYCNEDDPFFGPT